MKMKYDNIKYNMQDNNNNEWLMFERRNKVKCNIEIVNNYLVILAAAEICW
jgi:hypothetical protein